MCVDNNLNFIKYLNLTQFTNNIKTVGSGVIHELTSSGIGIAKMNLFEEGFKMFSSFRDDFLICCESFFLG